MTLDLTTLAEEIHQIDNAKWWTDLNTGASILETRNRGDLLMLVVTEICEAAEGLDGRMDDKLPDLPMYDCELGDTAIRALDLVGSEMAIGRLPRWQAQSIFENANPLPHGAELFDLVKLVALAKEAERKLRWTEFHYILGDIVMQTFTMAALAGINLPAVIEKKRAFNRVRADHQPENRRGADGKKS